MRTTAVRLPELSAIATRGVQPARSRSRHRRVDRRGEGLRRDHRPPLDPGEAALFAELARPAGVPAMCRRHQHDRCRRSERGRRVGRTRGQELRAVDRRARTGVDARPRPQRQRVDDRLSRQCVNRRNGRVCNSGGGPPASSATARSVRTWRRCCAGSGCAWSCAIPLRTHAPDGFEQIGPPPAARVLRLRAAARGVDRGHRPT